MHKMFMRAMRPHPIYAGSFTQEIGQKIKLNQYGLI